MMYSRVVILGLLALFGVLAIIYMRRKRYLGTDLAAEASGPSRWARIGEALVLAAVGIPILMMTATVTSSGGMLLRLDELRPEYARANLIVFLFAAAGVLAAILLAFFWRTWAAVLLMAVTLSGYGLTLNGPRRPCEWFVSSEATQPVVEYTIRLGGSNVAVADLWVNGVYLGKTPFITTLDEFCRKVPYWPKAPEDYETNMVKIDQHRPRGAWQKNYRKWIKFDLPRYTARGTAWNKRYPDKTVHERMTYYAQVRYAGEDGLTQGAGRGPGGSGGDMIYKAESHFSAVFPQREERLDRLLDKARLADYAVGIYWFEAIETFDEDGWIALRKAADSEPEMMNVLSDWATWRYGLDKVKDAETAWKLFESICDEADAQGQYYTASVAGRAVELLTPKLNPEQLVKKAERLIRITRGYTWHSWEANGRFQFGFSKPHERVNLVANHVSGGFSGGRVGSRRLSISGFPVAHAAWMLDELLDSHDDSQPNIVEQRITPALIRWHYSDGLPAAMMAAIRLEGPALDHFLMRQNWRASADDRSLAREDRIGFHGEEENKWLYLLASLKSPAGSEFRRKHADRVMDMADKFYQEAFLRWNNEMNFIFVDDWLAKKYWPRFARLARRKSRSFVLETQWRYLQQMGSAATVQMYLDAWRQTNISDIDNAPRVLDLLPPEKRNAVAQAVIKYVKTDASNLGEWIKNEEQARQGAIRLMQTRLGHGLDHNQAQRDLTELQERIDKKRCLDIALWLEHTRPDHPLVKMLAETEDPALRLLVMGAIKAYPTPHNRRLLAKLLTDPDQSVQSVAEKVNAQLKSLATDDPMRYASNPLAN